MTTGSRPSLDDALQRLQWAYRSLEGLQHLEYQFSTAELAASTIRSQPEPGVVVEFMRPDNPIPADIPRLSSETIGHVRSALDYLVYQLAWLDSGTTQTGTQFPIEDDEQNFWKRRRKTYLKGVSDAHAGVIAGVQPFSGAKWTKMLRSLSNPDKHRHIVSSVHHTGVTAEITAVDGDLPGQLDHEMTFRFSIFIAFDDGSPVIGTLNALAYEVGTLVEAFRKDFEPERMTR